MSVQRQFNKAGKGYHEPVLRGAFERMKSGQTLMNVRVYHDDWCAAYQGRACNCNPDIKWDGDN